MKFKHYAMWRASTHHQIHQAPHDDEDQDANSAAYLSEELGEVEDADETQSSHSNPHSPGVLNIRDLGGWGRGGPYTHVLTP